MTAKPTGGFDCPVIKYHEERMEKIETDAKDKEAQFDHLFDEDGAIGQLRTDVGKKASTGFVWKVFGTSGIALSIIASLIVSFGSGLHNYYYTKAEIDQKIADKDKDTAAIKESIDALTRAIISNRLVKENRRPKYESKLREVPQVRLGILKPSGGDGQKSVGESEHRCITGLERKDVKPGGEICTVQ